MLLLLIVCCSIFAAFSAIVPRRLVRARASRVIMQKLLLLISLLLLMVVVLFKTKHVIFNKIMVLGGQNILLFGGHNRGLWSLGISLLAVARSRHIFLRWRVEVLSGDWLVEHVFGRVGRLFVVIDLGRTLFFYNGLL